MTKMSFMVTPPKKEHLMTTATTPNALAMHGAQRLHAGELRAFRQDVRAARRQSGFSLIELMIAVVIVAILGAVAWPSYQDYTRKGNRSAAQQLLLEIATKQAQYMLDARSYTATIGSGGLNIARDGWTCTTNCTNTYYTVSVSVDNAATPPTFTATATPITTSIQASDGTINYTSTGTKTRMVSGTDKGW
jgi:type IV pilus assembly protein PilE